MSTTKTQKTTSKSVGKPLIKKIYDTHKKWLGSDKSPSTHVKAKRDVVIIHKKTNHTYENVEYKKNEETTRREEENSTGVGVDFDRKKSDKLRIVIDNFDKILEEYSDKDNPKELTATSTPKKPPAAEVPAKKDTKIPKLVKAKTCSIIESKCILKKSNSQPLGEGTVTSNNAAGTKLQNKTKSMSNIDNSTKCDKEFNVVRTGTSQTKTTLNKEKLVEDPPTKVKEMVKRLNSLTDTQETDSTKPADINTKQTMSKAKSTLDLSPSKKNLAFSKIPVNTTLRKFYPSIPCDLNNLDLDSGSAGAKKLNRKFAKSVQNLAQTTPRMSLPKTDNNLTCSVQNLDQVSSKLSLPRSGKNLGRSVQNLTQAGRPSVSKPLDKADKTKSVQNLSNIGKLCLSKTTDKSNSEHNIGGKLPLSKSIGKSVQNLSTKPSSSVSGRSSGKVGQNLQKRDFVPKTDVKPNERSKIVRYSTTNFDSNKEKAKLVKPIGKTANKPAQNLSKITTDVKTQDQVDGFVPVSKTLSTVKKLSSKVKEDEVSPEETLVVFKTSKEERVKSVVEKLEEVKEDDKTNPKQRLLKTNTFKKVATFAGRGNEVVTVHESLKKEETFGAQKGQFEPKFVEKSLKNNKGTYRKPRVDMVKLDLKKTQEFLGTIKMNASYYLDPEDFTDVKVEKVINYLQDESKMKKLNLNLDETLKKALDYNSDNSDDSGNISNEMELDCDDTNSSSSSVKSGTSSESLTTVLDVSIIEQDSGLEVSKKDFSLENNEKVHSQNKFNFI
ncbi:hypothetical protein NQ314_007236 [Rhamnusium bicolor]|uniref:Uncharacterized protein n=1 Tax=Rhamnusium bicolor TaxID=1586634 RepID=A0AAV8YQJ7_9CUCU|nr:hypothetical protein NQ314_007236 [Rhamnusium bicolor]